MKTRIISLLIALTVITNFTYGAGINGFTKNSKKTTSYSKGKGSRYMKNKKKKAFTMKHNKGFSCKGGSCFKN